MRWQVLYTPGPGSPMRLTVDVIAETIDEARTYADRLICSQLPQVSSDLYFTGACEIPDEACVPVSGEGNQ